MRVARLQAVAVIENDQLAVTIPPTGGLDYAISRHMDRGAFRDGYVDTGVECTFPGERVGTPSEGAAEQTDYRPKIRLGVRLPLVRVVVKNAREAGGLQKIVFFDGFLGVPGGYVVVVHGSKIRRRGRDDAVRY